MMQVDCPFVLEITRADAQKSGNYWDMVFKIFEQSKGKISIRIPGKDEKQKVPKCLKPYLKSAGHCFILEVADEAYLPMAKKLLVERGSMFGQSEIPFVGPDNKLEILR